MKTRTWSEAQIIRLLQLAEKGETTIADLCRAHMLQSSGHHRCTDPQAEQLARSGGVGGG